MVGLGLGVSSAEGFVPYFVAITFHQFFDGCGKLVLFHFIFPDLLRIDSGGSIEHVPLLHFHLFRHVQMAPILSYAVHITLGTIEQPLVREWHC